MRVAILGTGMMAQAFATRFAGTEHELRFGSRNPSRVRPPPIGGLTVSQKEAVEWGDLILLAVVFWAVEETVKRVGASLFRGKILVDLTNNLTKSGEWAYGFKTSGAEELARMVSGTRIVKAFNTVYAQNLTRGGVDGEKETLFVAGDDKEAKGIVMQLGEELGFDSVDSGPLTSARHLEALGMLLITLGYGPPAMGPGIGFRLLRRSP